MKLENKKLHEVPKPWYSVTKQMGAMGITFIIAIFSFVIIMAMTFDFSDQIHYLILVLFSFIGLIFLVFSLSGFYDQLDNWKLKLPYNHLLFETVSEKSEAMLDEKGYTYFKNGKIDRRSYDRDWKTRKPYAMSYKILTGSEDYIIYEFGLLHIQSDESNSYYFEAGINNIKMNNLEFAKKFQKDVHNMFEEIEYRKFKKVRKRWGAR